MNYLLFIFRKRWPIHIVFVFGLFYVAPFIDALTGYLVLSGITSESSIGSPSQLLRGCLFLMSISFIRKSSVNTFYFFAIYFISVEILNFFLYTNIKGLVIALVTAYKLLYPICIYLALKNLVFKQVLSFDDIKKLFFNSAFLYSIGIIVPFFLNIGFPTYEDGGFGTKGFFASGNGLGMFLGVMLLFLYQQGMYKTSRKDLIKFACVVLAVVFIATKATAIFLIIFLILLFLRLSAWLKTLIAFTLLTYIYIKYDEIISAIKIMFDVIAYRYETSPDFFTFILSGRNIMIRQAFEEYSIEGFYALRPIIGSGTFLSFRDPANNPQFFDMLESDLIDVFFMYGILGVAIYGYIFLKPAFFFFQKKLWIPLLLFSTVLFHSILAGHVIFNGMSILGVILMYIYTSFGTFKRVH